MAIRMEPGIPLQEKGGSREARIAVATDRSAEMAWLAHADPELIGKWVALSGNRVVSKGPTAKAVYDEAISQGVSVPFIAFVSPHRNEPFAGGWLD